MACAPTSGSYAEPIAGDENPETYGVPINSLHTDHVAADNTRRVNYIYAAQQYLPPSRIPGFIFHQSERTADNGTNACFGNVKECWDMNTRDFDLLGYKYSVLSTVGTAGQNNVLTMIPARDMQEYNLLPQEDRDFIKNWIAWTDEKLEYLRNTMPIATLPGPGIGNVDGTCAMSKDEGFLFLFNPNPQPFNASLAVDESMGITNSSVSGTWKITELYPNKGMVIGQWTHGQEIMLPVGGSDARVLQLELARDEAVAVIGAPGAGTIRYTGTSSDTKAITNVDLAGVEGMEGSKSTLQVQLHEAATNAAMSINGVACAGKANGKHMEVEVAFDGATAVYHSMPISPDAVVTGNWKGGWLNVSFTVPTAIKKQVSGPCAHAIHAHYAAQDVPPYSEQLTDMLAATL
jgi:hypothetical protein